MQGEGSLAQAGDSWNLNTNSSVALPAGKETSIFMIPGNAVHQILVATRLPNITGYDTRLDGGTQTANIGNANNTMFGTGGTVGVDAIALPQLNGPEIEITTSNPSTIKQGITIEGNNVTVRGLAVWGFAQDNRDLDDLYQIGVLRLSGANKAVVTGPIVEQNMVGLQRPMQMQGVALMGTAKGLA